MCRGRADGELSAASAGTPVSETCHLWIFPGMLQLSAGASAGRGQGAAEHPGFVGSEKNTLQREENRGTIVLPLQKR